MVSVPRLLAAVLVTCALALIPLGAASASAGTAKRIAFVKTVGVTTDIVTIGADGSGTINLDQSPANVSISTDGQKILFDDGVNISQINTSNGVVSPGCTAATEPAISPDGTKVAYVTAGSVKIGSLAGCAPLTDPSLGTGKSPAWSPDGTQIVFVDGGDDIAVGPSTGGSAEKLGTTGAVESEPTWSPDGTKIAFISGAGTAAELFVMNADGSARAPLTNNAVTESSPSWAPAGDELVYSVNDGTNNKLTVISANGSATRDLSDASTGATKPDWGLAIANTTKPTVTKPDSMEWAEGTPLSASQGDWISISGITSTSYQWQRCGSTGTGCTDIGGATSGTYTLTAADIGSTVRVRVTATTADGSAPGTSAVTPTIGSAKPNSVIPPTISGSPIVGGTLTATNGTWTGTNPVFTFQWQKCDSSGSASSCQNIADATANQFVPSQSDVGSTVRVVVTATNAKGSSSRASEPTAPIASRVPTNTAPPAISEITSAADNSTTYSASTGTWTGAATITFKYQWRRCNASNTTSCSDIGGATTATYIPVAADIGSRLRVVVTATNSFGTANTTSEASNVVPGAVPVNTFPPTISGDPETGSVLTSTNGTWTGSAPITYTYEWRRCNAAGASCGAIAGATTQSYIVQAADTGSRIMLAVTAKNAAGTTTAVSAPTLVITASTTPPTPNPPSTGLAPSNTRAPSFTGVLARGQKLTANAGTWSGATPMTFSYQWQRCSTTATVCTAITGATNATYTLAAVDVGRRIRLAVTATNTQGSVQEFSLISRLVAAKKPATAAPKGRRINGTPRADRLNGGAGPDTIRAGAGNDRINPGRGRDRVFGGAGNDTVSAADKTRDVIDCGSGVDTVTADKVDVLRGCERVRRR
jgi:hypothetical protein